MRVANGDHVSEFNSSGWVKRVAVSCGRTVAELFRAAAVAVQRAVLDGADLRATDDTGKTPSALAEELGHFTITHFLLAYSALQAPPEGDGERDPAGDAAGVPAPPRPAASPEAPVEEEIVSPATGPQPERIEKSYFERLTTLNPEPRAVAQAPQALPESRPTESQPAESQTETQSGQRPDKQAEARTAIAGNTAAVSQPFEPEPEIAEAPASIPMPAPAPEAAPETVPETALAPELPALPEPETAVAGIAAGDNRLAPAPRKPGAVSGGARAGESGRGEMLGGEEVVAMIPAPAPGEEQAELPERPASEPETRETAMAEGPSKTPPQPETPAAPSDGATSLPSGSFMTRLRRFEGGEPGTLTPEDLALPPPGSATAAAEIPGAEFYPAPGGRPERNPDMPTRQLDARTDDRVPEHERLRAEAIARLQRESAERLAQLEDARRIAADERERTRQGKEFLAGIANVEAEARAQQRLELSGTPYPPGFVPPPDGGSSAIRFLQRLGIVKEQPTGLAEPVEPRAGRNGSKIGPMGPVAMADPAQALTPQDLRALSFIDSGYAAPPRGRNIDTDDDRSIGALQQIARLLSTPDQRFPSNVSGVDGATTSQFPAGQSSGSAAARPALPVPGTGQAPASALPTPALPPEPAAPGQVPLPSAALDDLIAETQPDPGAPQSGGVESGWGATTTDPGGDVLARATGGDAYDPSLPQSGLVDRLSSLFDPADPGAVGSGGPIRDATGEPPVITEPTGTWDVVAVEPAAPPPPRMLLGGPVRQYAPPGSTRGDIDLAIGRTVLGKAPPVQADPTTLRKSCVDKRRGTVTFCIEPADWPEPIRQFMRVDTVMYQGLSMISRYDNGVATRFYSLFPSVEFEQIVRYFADVLGEPSTIWKRSIAPLAQPRAENPTVIWKAQDPTTQTVSVLEIRQYDDTRGGFPDEQRGAIMLYRAQAGPIFPHVSALELMRLRPG